MARDFNYERVCSALGTDFPPEFEIPRANTGGTATMSDGSTIDITVE